MADHLIFTKQEISFLRELVSLNVDFMIVGLSAAALQGAPVVTQDVDLWFKDLSDARIRKALKRVGGDYIPPIGMNPPMFGGKGVALFDIVVHMHGLGKFSEEIKHTVRVPMGTFSVAVLPLERIILSKKASGRQKDLLVLPVLEDARLAQQDTARGLTDSLHDKGARVAKRQPKARRTQVRRQNS